MPFRSLARAQSGAALVWLLALLLPCQATAVAWIAAAGAAHSHAVDARDGGVQLVDFRRDLASIAAAHATRIHDDQHASGERHHHASEEAHRGSFAVLDAWSSIEGDAPDDGRAMGGLAFLPLIGSPTSWHGTKPDESFGATRTWSPTTTVGSPLERPPR